MLKELTKGSTFEKVRRWSLVAAVSSIILLVLLYILEAWGAFEFGSYDDWSWEFNRTFWGKLQDSLGVIAGAAFAVIVMVLFLIPRKKD